LKETPNSSVAHHIFSDIVVEKCNLSTLYERLEENKHKTNEVKTPLWLKYKKLNKVSASLAKAVTSELAKSPMQSFIHTAMKRDALLKLYINKFIKVMTKQSIDVQTFILSKLRNFLKKVVGKIFIQTFTNRFTRQSIQLLPAY